MVKPTVSSVSPNSGVAAGGTSVTITGTNFAAGATVTFGSTAATNVVVVNSTTITATTPAGTAGAVTVTVTVNSQSGSLTNGFTYVGQPTVTSVSPNNGPAAGGTGVTITGTNFASGATVTFGSTAATNVVVVNSTTITATTPAGSIGAVTVTVTNIGSQSGSLTNGFTYNATVAIGFGQVASSTPQSPTATVTVAYPAAQTAGDLNVVVVGWNDTTSTVQSVKDSVGNTYSLAIGPTSGSGMNQSIYYAANISGRQQHGDGDVQPGGGLSGCAHFGVSGCDDAGCEGWGEREQCDSQQWSGNNDERERVDLWREYCSDDHDCGRDRVHISDHHGAGW